MPKLEVSWKNRLIRLWISPTHSYTLGFYNPKIDADWYVLFGGERWRERYFDDGTTDLVSFAETTIFSIG